MFFFTHLHYAKLLYPELSTLFHLDKKAFSYGNIKPDLPSKNRRAHLMEEYLEEVNQSGRLDSYPTRGISNKSFSS